MSAQRRSCRKRPLPSSADSLPSVGEPLKKPMLTMPKKKNIPGGKLCDRIPESCYTPNQHTLFLSDDNLHFSWEPFQSSQKAVSTLLRHFVPHGSDVHSYFTSTQAAQFAAARCDSISIFRHIGHVTLHKFQQLDRLPRSRNWFPAVKKSSETFINLCTGIQSCWSEDEELVSSLQSLATVQQAPWQKPFIVLLAKRTDVVRACDVVTYDDDFDLDVQVYASRLLFEIIACRDIRQLFTYLKVERSYSSVPQLPEYPDYFTRSPFPPTDNRNSLARILRDAESTGYATLTDEQRKKIEKNLTVKLYPYQDQTVRWMLDKENGQYTLNDYFWEERLFTDTSGSPGGKYYYFPLTGEVRLRCPPRIRGGMVTEEMGLGKTVEALALILAQRTDYRAVEMDVFCETNPSDVRVVNGVVHLSRLRMKNQERSYRNICGFHHGDEILGDPNDVEFPGNVKIRRWPAKSTLVVCPKSLIGQWKQEICRCAPSLTFEVWETMRDKTEGALSVAVGEKAKDIVLTTYDRIRSDSNLSTISWRRVILDEAQVTRRSSTQVAKDVFNLRSDVRFLMTGTPFVNSINDLKGQLASLKVWPFALEDDGFWERYVSYPFTCGCEVEALPYLLKVTMMRHSKAQKLDISLSSRSYETIKVQLTGSYRACYYYVLASCFDELESLDPYQIDTRRLRTLLRLLLTLCLSPHLLSVVSLDLARRFTWSRKSHPIPPCIRENLQKVSFEEAIRFVAESGRGVVRDSNRSYALGVNTSELQRFSKMPLKELREHVVNQNILSENRAMRTTRDRLVALSAGGVHRLSADTVIEMRRTAISLGLASKEEVESWSRSKIRARLTLHYDLENGIQSLRTVHESGFSALMKLMDGRGNPSCPVCLTDCDGRVTVTKCGHMYCLECMLLLLSGCAADSRCAICRRDISTNLAVEIMRTETKRNEIDLEQGNDRNEEALPLKMTGHDLRISRGQRSPSNDAFEVSSSRNRENATSSDSNFELRSMSAQEAWRQFELCGPPSATVSTIGRNERFPSLGPEFLRHLAAVRSDLDAAPKLKALLNLIRSSSLDVKFCVVAGSVESLRVIAGFLDNEGIKCVGAGALNHRGNVDINEAPSGPAERFRTDATVRVFLISPSTSAGLTLTAASVVVFMETLVRVADEIQAAARVHRIGQKRDVRIVRIVAEGTMEERIVERRGEITSAEMESRVLALASNETSDRLILQLFGHAGGRNTESNRARI